MKVIGIDILPHTSPSSSSQACYAVAIIDNGQVVARYPKVRFNDLLKLIFEEHPDIVATDNVFELAEDKNSLMELLRKLCLVTDVVQVTMNPDSSTTPLSVIAKREGLAFGDKLSPLEAAEVIARLAYKGVGCRLKIYEEKTKIIVTRARTLKAGGMSRPRYQRRIYSLILRVSKKIKETLDKFGFDYDVFYRKGPSGLERCLFIVYAPRRSLQGLIKPMKGHDIVVKISPIERQDIAFEPLKGNRPLAPPAHRYLIVGIDPGIVAGLALIDVDGNPIYIVSKRYLSRSDIVSIIYEYGTPVIVATDVDHPPTMVKKLASMLNVPIFTPPQTLCVTEKEKLVQEYLKSLRKLAPSPLVIKDSHQRDALAAALKAYKHYKPKFDQAKEKIIELHLEIPFKEVKALIIRGYSVSEAIKEVMKKYSQKLSPKQVSPQQNTWIIESLRRRLYKQAELILRLTEERDLLMDKIKELRNKVKELENKLNELSMEQSLKLRESRTLMSLSRQIDELREALAKAEQARSSLERSLKDAINILKCVAKGEIHPVKPLRALTMDGVKELEEEWTISEDDILFVTDISYAHEDALKSLQSKNILGLISLEEPPEHVKHELKAHGLPIIVISEEDIIIFNGIPLVRDVERLRSRLRKMRNELRRFLRSDRLRMFKRLLQEYRDERRRELIGDT
ncbi:MAG: hypothetical protein DRJ66_06315 [Thermoprotei archaeon]|nr:MAG: hypothetical protein DRJ66_06315 [Thermoprotei archaeon]RLF18433.1 MAG: hypothetical protein DRZ82_08225 [Thermoprotei archaeon]